MFGVMKHAPRSLYAALIAAVGLSLSSSASAENSVVVELFTSQGCSSCPPADRVLESIRDREGVIALSLNVDYWDYLGWKDELALPGNAQRQSAYAREMRSRRVYTPQILIDGKLDVIGSRRGQVESALDTFLREPDMVPVTMRWEGDAMRIEAPPAKEEVNATVWLVGYDNSVTSRIERGENSGRSVTYTNVVREWTDVGRWDGRGPLSLIVPAPVGKGGCVAIIQERGVGQVLGAAKVSYKTQ